MAAREGRARPSPEGRSGAGAQGLAPLHGNVPPQRRDVNAGRQHLERLAASPRPAGSSAEAGAREYCAGVLRELGFTVTEERFEYSSAPGRWATPVAGVASVLAIGAAAYAGSAGGSGALIVLGLALLVGVPGAIWLARRGILDFPLGRETGINLRATISHEVPAVWLVAHLDSKSQPVPTAVRAAGIVGLGTVWAIAVIVAISQAVGSGVPGWWPWIFGAAVIGAVPVAASIVGPHSPGALDNASGVATVLEAVARLESRDGLGVLLTSAEELGLAGARAFARRETPGIAMNCDGVDDRGTLLCMRAGGAPSRVVSALAGAARDAGVAFTVRGLIPGLLVDSVALESAGWDSATLSRGSWSTLARVHRPHDDLHHLDGRGVAEASAVLAGAVERLRLDLRS